MNLSIDLTVTALYASLLALVFLSLSFNVIRLRLKLKVGVGDGEERMLTKAIRMHGNFAEYTPLALILLASYELNGANTVWLHVLGAALLLGRILHPVGLHKSIGTSIPRFAGVILTFVVLLVLAIENIRLFLMA